MAVFEKARGIIPDPLPLVPFLLVGQAHRWNAPPLGNVGKFGEISKSIGTTQASPLCQKCARIGCFHAIGVSFERKADSPNC
jgi:hypothetical protein